MVEQNQIDPDRPSKQPLFDLGRTVATATVLAEFARAGAEAGALPYIVRHQHGDWGDAEPSDWQANERALRDGERIFSIYHLTNGTKIYIVTEHDRSITTVMLASDY